MQTDGADKTTALEKLFEVGIVKRQCGVMVKVSDLKYRQSSRLFHVSPFYTYS